MERAVYNTKTAYFFRRWTFFEINQTRIPIEIAFFRLERTDIKQTELMTMRARLLLNLGLVLEEQKEPHQAVDLIEKAAELCKKHKLDDDLHRSHLALGGLHERQEKFDLALRHYDKATEIGDSAMKAVGRLTKAELLLRIGKWSEARQVLVQLYLTKNLEQSTSKQIEKLLRIGNYLFTRIQMDAAYFNPN